MNGRDRQRGSGDYPRYARVPASGGRSQADVRDPRRHPQRQRSPQPRRAPNQNQSRSRALAVAVLVVAAVIIIMTGLAVDSRSDSSGTGETIPFNLLPFPENAVTSTT